MRYIEFGKNHKELSTVILGMMIGKGGFIAADPGSGNNMTSDDEYYNDPFMGDG